MRLMPGILSRRSRLGVNLQTSSSLQSLPAGECLGDCLVHQAIDVLAGVEADRLHLGGVCLWNPRREGEVWHCVN